LFGRDRPAKELKVSKKFPEKRGAGYELNVNVSDLGFWNEGRQKFDVEPGNLI
jgi:hypothetical protein